MSRYLFCYYGDDFTGSTDALEALAANGVPAVLFLDPPAAELLARFPQCRAVGIAGESRSQGPGWMSDHLPAIFARLAALDPGVCHYKVCSTFDSSPVCGSIGRALEIGQDVFHTSWVPVIPAAPHLRRFVLFGNLFAAGGGTIHRIDRHPTMRQHPVTPMDEGDLRIHLARQTGRPISLLDVLALRGRNPEEQLDGVLSAQPRAVIFDGLDEATLSVTGRLLWQHRAQARFAVGSSGLIESLVREWRELGEIPREYSPAAAAPVDRIVVVSGSCSPVTEQQIRWATANGFAGIPVGPQPEVIQGAVGPALDALARGRGVVVYSALGPAGRAEGAGGEGLGRALGILLRDILLRSGVRRAVVAGGDTSSHSVRQLDVDALTFAGRMTPGAPLCHCHAPGRPLDGLELVLKGGQMGPENFFEMVRRTTI